MDGYIVLLRGMGWINSKDKIYLQVLQVVAVQVGQESEELLNRLLPPPMPKEEKSFWMSLLPQAEQETVFSFPIPTRVSKC